MTFYLTILHLQSPCPENNASFLSRITFWWMTGLMITGYRHPLTNEDLWDLNEKDKAYEVAPLITTEWNKEMRKMKHRDSYSGTLYLFFQVSSSPSLALALLRAFGGTFFFGGFLKFLHDCLVFVSPQLLRELIRFTANKDEPVWSGYLWAALMFLSAIVQSLILHQYFHRCFVTGMRLRTAIISIVYRKSLKLNSIAKRQSTVGEIVNLMSVDAQRFMDLTTYLHMIWSAPFQIAVCMYFLWDTLGPSVLAGLGILILMIPINAYLSMKIRQLQVRQMKLKDERIKLMNEVLNGIKVLKLYAWEKSFIRKISGIREKEIKLLKSTAMLAAASSFAWSCAPFLVALCTFSAYVLSGNELTAEKAFVGLSLFNVLRFPIMMFPNVITNVIQASVSIKRLSAFLKYDELDPNNVHDIMPPAHDDSAVLINDGTFTWGGNDESTCLKKINLRIRKGSLVAIVGHVGSGKSSLLSSILGEMQKVEGRVHVQGSVAYVPQQAWIQNATLKNNVLFASEYSPRYERIIEACALEEDLEMLPAGDSTEIGEKGINLSGGQKQRVSLARAVFSDADIFLLDDPLSAVDAHVGKHIFKHVIGPNGELKNKTRLLVTHTLGFLPQVDQVVVIDNGVISEVGTYAELLAKKGSFSEFVTTFTNTEMNKLQEEHHSDLTELKEIEKSMDLTRADSVSSLVSRIDSLKQSKLSLNDDKVAVMKQVQELNEKKKLIEGEKSETGRVRLGVYLKYAKSLGYVQALLVTFFAAATQISSVGTNVWLADWSSNPNASSPVIRDRYLGIYGAIGAAQALFQLCSSFCLAYTTLTAAYHLHSIMLDRIMRSPMSFFDTTPLGRIVNRFSKDIYIIDEILPVIIRSCFMCVFSVSSTIIIICVSTPIFLAIIPPLVIMYFFTQRFYIATSRQLKRIESVSRSPIYSHFGETLQGVATIRAYKVQTDFINATDEKIDKNQMAYYPSISSNRWLATRLEFLGNCIVLFASLFAVIGRNSLPPGIVGLSVSYALQITQTLNWLVRMSSELETNIVSVERIKEYTEIHTEAAWDVPDSKPDSDWPTEGIISLENYKVRYRENLDLVLKGINCKIASGEKIGIVGRTGAGKSSLTLALFRILEAAEGNISIDGIDISTIGLHDLRSRLTIIPQDPVLFAGTIRMNLDPFDIFTDEEVWYALECAHLKGFVVGLDKKLDNEVAEGGENLSAGQRQLICLARALLRKTKVLILDEATAAVDMETDDLIQATIRTQFANCTVLTIAHRLNTIMDSTRVLVLDAGRIIEFDTPSVLMSDPESAFYAMAKDAGLV
ncbi:uncharacterized protein TRIADDRAFT_51152 [Trichoplax adhaerens]|uniref:Multidrug resistance-associated protein 1 n=1 Tax=Trichoplax adhaerens TaxID=10228 RepID=B3SCI9_TRIAD|nr:hypothetical protein TRIADDRAFT_51152 [Trichoplax adhaerens]EDV19525.1 hypothetical protein TRIADDRAFT_51152 [Trichoplax adhaerens]|eukprot:XP_002117957.1 hypothetical protein TRIADDRAFT_51152 [Trichoplax adhaerens]